jgi:hypothetical protein
MTRYSSLLGQRVEARYRAGDIFLSAIGTLVSDSGRAISVEELFSLDGRNKVVRVEIPYDYVVRVSQIEDKHSVAVPSDPVPSK